MKRYITIFLFSLLLLPFIPTVVNAEIVSSPEPYHYENGLFDDEFIIKENTFIPELIDNDLSSQSIINGHYMYVEFNVPVNILGLFLDPYGTWASYNIDIHFLNNDEIKIYTYRIPRNDLGYQPLNIENVIKIEINHPSGEIKRIREIDFFGTYDTDNEITVPENVTNIDYTTTHNSITLNYDLPIEFDYLTIEINGQTYDTTSNNYTIEQLAPDTEYEITIKTVLDNISSSGTKVNVRTDTAPIEPEKPEDVPEVENLTIEVKPERVDLYWNKPARHYGKAIIYRKELDTRIGMLNMIVPVAKANTDDYEPIFETNGDEFSDLTVKEGNDYEYKVTNWYNGLESTGITVQTGSIPKPPIIDLDGLEIPFKTNDLLDVIMWFVSLVTGFILLSLAIRFAPRMINVVKNAIGGR